MEEKHRKSQGKSLPLPAPEMSLEWAGSLGLPPAPDQGLSDTASGLPTHTASSGDFDRLICWAAF